MPSGAGDQIHEPHGFAPCRPEMQRATALPPVASIGVN